MPRKTKTQVYSVLGQYEEEPQLCLFTCRARNGWAAAQRVWRQVVRSNNWELEPTDACPETWENNSYGYTIVCILKGRIPISKQVYWSDSGFTSAADERARFESKTKRLKGKPTDLSKLTDYSELA